MLFAVSLKRKFYALLMMEEPKVNRNVGPALSQPEGSPPKRMRIEESIISTATSRQATPEEEQPFGSVLGDQDDMEDEDQVSFEVVPQNDNKKETEEESDAEEIVRKNFLTSATELEVGYVQFLEKKLAPDTFQVVTDHSLLEGYAKAPVSHSTTSICVLRSTSVPPPFPDPPPVHSETSGSLPLCPIFMVPPPSEAGPSHAPPPCESTHPVQVNAEFSLTQECHSHPPEPILLDTLPSFAPFLTQDSSDDKDTIDEHSLAPPVDASTGVQEKSYPVCFGEVEPLADESPLSPRYAHTLSTVEEEDEEGVDLKVFA